jgi:hypothetical protein
MLLMPREGLVVRFVGVGRRGAELGLGDGLEMDPCELVGRDWYELEIDLARWVWLFGLMGWYLS